MSAEKFPQQPVRAQEPEMPGNLSPDRQKELRGTLVDLDLVRRVSRNPTYDGPERRAREIERREIEEIEGRRGLPLYDALPAVEQARAEIARIVEEIEKIKNNDPQNES